MGARDWPSHVGETYADIERIRGILREHGLLVTPVQRRALARRKGYEGRNFTAKLLKATHYFPETPCPLHPIALFSASQRKCADCNREWRDLYREHQHDRSKRALKIAQAHWRIERGIPWEKHLTPALRRAVQTEMRQMRRVWRRV